MHFRKMWLRFYRKIKLNRCFRLVSTLVLAVALFFSSTAIPVYATSLIPVIGTAGIEAVENAAVGSILFDLLAQGIEFSFEVGEWTVDKFLDLTGLNDNEEFNAAKQDLISFLDPETETVIHPVQQDPDRMLRRKKDFEEKSDESQILQPIVLTEYQLEVLAGAYDIRNQTLYTPYFYTDTNHGYTINSERSYDNLSSIIAVNSITASPYSYWAINNDNYKYFINLNDFTVSLYNSDFSVNISNNYFENYHEGPNGYWQSPRFRPLDSLVDGVLVTHKSSVDGGSYSAQNTFDLMQQSFWLHRYYVNGFPYLLERNLTNALFSLWGSKNTDIYVGWSLSDRHKLENPHRDTLSYSGQFIASYNYPVPMYIAYPEGSSIDYTEVFEALISAINNKSTFSFSDIEDLVVDVNGQKAISTYEVIRYDYDVLEEEIFGSNKLIVSPDPEYIEAYGSGLETAGNIINSTVSVIPSDISLFFFGGSFVLLIILVLRRGSE